jgi:L-ribulose-5-phosphate 3-epimerase
MKNIAVLFLLLSSHVFSQKSLSSVKPTFDPHTWKLGVALYSFHELPLSGELAKADSAGVHYVEGFSFGKAGPEFKDSSFGQLSPEGIEKVNAMVKSYGLKMESIYLAGGGTVDAWNKQFKLAKELHVKFVTAEPNINMWDAIDSLAGVYGLKVAIHNHWRGMSRYWSPDTVLAAIKNHPNFGVCADLGHWPKSGLDAVESLKKLQGHIIAIHLKDIAAANNPKLQDVPVGTGIVDFPAVFKELERQHFDGYIYIERDAQDKPSNLPSVIQTVKYYNSTLGLTPVDK